VLGGTSGVLAFLLVDTAKGPLKARFLPIWERGGEFIFVSSFWVENKNNNKN